MNETAFALTVLELEKGEYHWILLEPMEDAAEDEVMAYRLLDSSMQGYRTYTQALAHGSAAMRTHRGVQTAGRRVAILATASGA